MGLALAALEKAVPTSSRLLLDTSTVIAYLNGGEPVTAVAQHIIDRWVHDGRNAAAVSMVTVMEVLVHPLKTNPAHYRQARDFLRSFPNLTPYPVDIDVAIEAAALRATHAFKPPDALIIATGYVYQVSHLVTNDNQWQKKLAPVAGRIGVVTLSDFVK